MLPKLKRSRLVWKSPSHRLEMSSGLSKSIDSNRRRPPSYPQTSSPLRPGSVPPSTAAVGSRSADAGSSSSLSPGVDNERDRVSSLKRDFSPPGRRSGRPLRAHFCDGIDTRGRLIDDGCVRDSFHECHLLRRRCSSAENLERRFENSRAEAAVVDMDRRELMRRLREAELDGRAAARQVTELRELVRSLRRNESLSSSVTASNQTQVDLVNLCRQKDDLLRKVDLLEESNRHLRDLVRTADVEMGRARELEVDKEATRRQLSSLEIENGRLSKALADSEATRASLQRQVHAREGDIERLTVQLRNIEKKYGRDSQEIMSNYEQLKRATRAWKSKWQKAERDLDQMRRQASEMDCEATEKMRDLCKRLEICEADRERLRTQLEEVSARMKDADNMLFMSRTGERELTTEMATIDRRLRDTCGELEILKRRNCELVCEIEAAADREVQSRMSHEQASREFDVLRERMSARCVELEELVARLKNGGVSAAEARDTVMEMRLQRCRDELEATRTKYNQIVMKLEELQRLYDQTKGTNRSLLDYISRLRKAYSDNFGTLATEACPGAVK